jgi:glycosyltransferase involved in cell wall biosynthesis
MGKYKILLPVTNNPELVRQKLIDIPDKTKLILINNFDNEEVEDLCKRAEGSGSEVHRYPKNLGLAASWNVGLRKMVEEDLDFIIFLSVSARFDKSINYFVDKIYHVENKKPYYRYLASPTATLHCFAHTRKAVEVGGYFDENFWPIYHEDTDFCCRSTLNGFGEKVRMLNLRDVVSSISYSLSMSDRRLFRLFQLNAERMGDYFIEKWGRIGPIPLYKSPFNNPNYGINDWKVDTNIFTWPPGIYEGNFDD